MSAIRKSARGEACQVRIPGVCCHDNETTVFAHMNGGGMGKKQSDLFGSYACSQCHAAVDKLPAGRNIVDIWQAEKLISFYEGIWRTQQILLDKGLITIKGK